MAMVANYEATGPPDPRTVIPMPMPTRMLRRMSLSKFVMSITILVSGTLFIQGLLLLTGTEKSEHTVLYDVKDVARPATIAQGAQDSHDSVDNTPLDNATIHIGFLKVHKAASTTTQAIFLRFGWRRNLTFVLPHEYNRFGFPNIISMNESITRWNTLPPPRNKTFDILCHHVIYGKDAWASVLPEDSVTIGIIREPTALFTSMVNYMRPGYIGNIPANDTLGTYLLNPWKYEPREPRMSLTNNRLAFEYGVHPDIIKQRKFTAFKEYLDVLDKKFELVVVAERFDESLVILKRYLNWTLHDVLYTSKNVRNAKKIPFYAVNGSNLQTYKNHSIFDYKLYDYFQQKLTRQIHKEGVSFKEEVANFREVREDVETFCHKVPKTVLSVTIRESKWNSEFGISREDCGLLNLQEINFTQKIRQRQYGNATWGQNNKS